SSKRNSIPRRGGAGGRLMGGYDEEASRRRHRLADPDSLCWRFAIRCHLSAAKRSPMTLMITRRARQTSDAKIVRHRSFSAASVPRPRLRLGLPLGGSGCPIVLIGGPPAWRTTAEVHARPLVDGVQPHVGGVVAVGSMTVRIGGLAAA